MPHYELKWEIPDKLHVIQKQNKFNIKGKNYIITRYAPETNSP